jgi:fatty acid amide hydrolase 2
VKDNYAEARKEARQADEQIAKNKDRSKLPPYLGVPCTIKEAFAMTGFPRTSGLVSRKDHIMEEDAEAVRRIRSTGAIPLGITNVSELCMWMESINRLYGRTNNPYDLRRTVGGSSGGEGAIIGGGGSPFGLGSDVGGSIRMPAFFNGVFGHKPSGGLVPATGQYPIAHGKALHYLTTGILCRKAEDLYPLTKVVAGPDGKDSACTDIPLGDPGKVSVGQLKVISIPGNGTNRVSKDLQAAQERCETWLRSQGCTVERIQPAQLKHSFDIWSTMLAAAGGPSFAELMGNGDRVEPVPELFKFLVGSSPHTLPAIMLALLEDLSALLPGREEKFLKMGEELENELNELLAGDSVLLYPSYSTPAPLHYKPLLSTFPWVYTAILNVMRLPVTQVPLGLNGQGVPLGIQVGARHGQDHLTMAVAMGLEEAFGGWAVPWKSRRSGHGIVG